MKPRVVVQHLLALGAITTVIVLALPAVLAGATHPAMTAITPPFAKTKATLTAHPGQNGPCADEKVTGPAHFFAKSGVAGFSISATSKHCNATATKGVVDFPTFVAAAKIAGLT